MDTQSRIVPTHNLFGDHGPRCVPCSGLGHVLDLGSTKTRYTSRCRGGCQGTGVDREAVFQSTIDRLERELRETQRRFEEHLARSSRQRTPPIIKNSRQYWMEMIAWATADGTAVANTTTEAIIFPNVTIPANYMNDGRALRIRAFGKLSTTGTPTMIWALRWGGVSGTLLATTEAITQGSGVTNVNWSLEALIQSRANGASGSLLVMGDLGVHSAAGTVLSNVFGVSGFDAPAAVTVDLTADTAFSITADWSAASASNTLTGMMYQIESQN